MSAHPKSVLVTGGCGFIGSNLVRRLTANGYAVKVIDNFSIGNPDNLKGQPVAIYQADLSEPEQWSSLMEGVTSIVHLAAQTSVPESIQNPFHDFQVNVRGTLNLLMASRRYGIKKFIFASSNAPLGRQNSPVHEGMAPLPLSPYGASKLAGEGYCLAFAGSYKLNTMILRFSNVYGPFSNRKDSVVARFIKNIWTSTPLTIYGDGSQTRDFIYADDLCQAILLCLESERDLSGEIFQIGTGAETSIQDLVSMLGQLSGKPIKVEHQAIRPGEIKRNYSNISKAKALLGFSSTCDLEAGLRQTVTWFEKHTRRNWPKDD